MTVLRTVIYFILLEKSKVIVYNVEKTALRTQQGL